jgi:hypothetical protein
MWWLGNGFSIENMVLKIYYTSTAGLCTSAITVAQQPVKLLFSFMLTEMKIFSPFEGFCYFVSSFNTTMSLARCYMKGRL